MKQRVKLAMHGLRLTEVMPEGWMKEQVQRDVEGFVGHLDEFCSEASADIFGENKVNISSKDFWGTWWNGESEGNWADGLVRTAYLSESEWARKKAERYISRLLKNRGADGYIGIYRPDSRYSNGESDGELWTQSRAMLTMLAGYEATGNKEVLDAAIACARLTVSRFGPGADGRSYYSIPEKDGSKSHGLTIIEPMLMLYDITGDESFLEFSVFLYEDYSNTPINVPFNDLQLGLVLDPEKPYLSHGPHTCEHLRIPLLLYYYTGIDKYRIAYRNAYNKIKNYIGISGACKSDEMIGSYAEKREKLDPKTANVVFPGAPLPEAGYEYCATTELLLSLHSALMLTGDMEYADMAERLFFNAAMAARQSSGKGIGYLSADNLYAATKAKGTRWDYSPTHDDAAVCCIPNAGRLLPYHVSRMWMKPDKDTLAAVFYGPCKLTTGIAGNKIEIDEQTLFPFDDKIGFTFKLDNAVKCGINLRLPAWCDAPQLFINGKAEPVNREDGFAVIDREWKDGDEIILSLPSGIKIEKAFDGSAAVVRGPLVYSLNIAGVWTKTRDYGVEGFCDMDCVAAEGQTWDFVLKVENSRQQSKFFEVVKQDTESAFPWDQSPVAIKAHAFNNISQPAEILLVPIGCTDLRRTCFPHFAAKE